jgi:glucosamine--fructose-6-phosphate aminotransferase (isomerizing)
VEIASEFRYNDPIIDENTLTIVLSQSGETIDTLEALKLAKSKGSKVISIVNVKGSTIARESDYVLYTHAGPEIAVASTKAYTVQVAAMYLIACRMGLVKNVMTESDAKQFMTHLQNMPNLIEDTLKIANNIKRVANHIKLSPDAFYIGRGLDYTMSLEAALKLKEISYVHAEAYAAGELKHGTIALIEKGTPVIAVITQENINLNTRSNIEEVKARGAKTFVISMRSLSSHKDKIIINDVNEILTPIVSVVPTQYIAYYAALSAGRDIDKPRNLAKSVTVE